MNTTLWRLRDPTRISNWDGIFGYAVDEHYSGYSDDNGFLALHSTMYSEYQAVAQQLGVDFVPSVTQGFNDRATRRTCTNDPALARRTSAGAAEGSMFDSFLKDLALPYANKTKFKMVHVKTFNEWHEDNQVEPPQLTLLRRERNTPRGLCVKGMARPIWIFSGDRLRRQSHNLGEAQTST
jgi:hypothetical protein